MIHNNRDHGYGWDQNHGITRNYDLKIQDHGFPQIKITWSQDLLRSKSWDHGFFDHGSQKLQFVRSCDHDLWSFFIYKKKRSSKLNSLDQWITNFHDHKLSILRKWNTFRFRFVLFQPWNLHRSPSKTKHTKMVEISKSYLFFLRQKKRTYWGQLSQ